MRVNTPDGMTRRHFLSHLAGATALTAPALMFGGAVRANSELLQKRGKSAIMLWMGGGPSTIDLWDLKPGAATGGPFKPISTSGDVQICEHLPMLATQMHNLSVVRSMSTREADAPSAFGCVSRESNDIGGLLCGVDLRNDDPIGAQVQDLLDWHLIARRYANNARDFVPDRLQDRQDIAGFQLPVFAIDEQPVEPRIREDFSRRRRRQRHHGPYQNVATQQPRPKSIHHRYRKLSR